jgi:EmrB/QacA subfamily drug resistance transporter
MLPGTMSARQRWTLVCVCVATFMLLLDITVVNVALPSIQRSLHGSFTDLQWVVDAYSLMLATLLLTAGSLADLLGRRRIFVVGLGLFAAASLLCGLATTPLFLNLARGAQGVGGAMMFATSLALLAQEFQGKERGVAFGIWGATIGGAVAIGPLVGGALTSGFGWEWIFFVNVPIGIVAIFATLRFVHESSDPEAGRIDWLGVVTFSASLFCLVFALIRGNDEGWSSGMIVSLLVASAVLMTCFVLVERRQESPMLDLTLFRKPAFVGVSAAAFALSASMFAMFLYLTLYLQGVLGYSPFQAGLRFLPISVISFFAAPIAGRLSARVPLRVLLGVGLILVGGGLLLMSGLSVSSGWTHLIAGFIIAGAGVGITNPSLATTAVGVVQPARSGMASGINNTFRQAGIATGIAGLGAIFQSQVQSRLTDALAGTPAAGRSHAFAHAVSSGQASQVVESAPPASRAVIAHASQSAFVGALNDILVVAALVALVGAVLAAALVRQEDFVAQPQPAPAAA